MSDFQYENGIAWWRADAKRAQNCDYVICTHNQHNSPDIHRKAFLIGKVSGVTKNGYGRVCVNISDYAYLDIQKYGPVNRTPCSYISTSDLGFNPTKLDWKKFDPDTLTSDDKNLDPHQAEREVEAEPLSTTRKALIEARIGQGAFRTALLKKWKNECPVTGCTIPEVLRASHILAWADKRATNQDRLSPDNGLLLAASVDALFDRHLISFSDNGELILTESVADQIGALGIREYFLPKLNKEQRKYLAFHRAKLGKG
jgi:hypothetical protein